MLSEYIAARQKRVDAILNRWIRPSDALSARLVEAMHYSVFNGGKRIRPVLLYAAVDAILPMKASQVSYDPLVDVAAAALECIHAYSLIHDDLPAMDDDDLRRGLPTCHIAFDDATAILAGDALQSLAFEKLANLSVSPSMSAGLLQMLALLATASGDRGMVGGQMLDLLAEDAQTTTTLTQLETIHRHKTGALIRAALSMGAISANASAQQRQQLETYADAIGLAFQVQDDIIDVTSDTATLGKIQGADLSLNKTTYVSALGLDGAKAKAASLRDAAYQSLLDFSDSADTLRQIADYIVARDR